MKQRRKPQERMPENLGKTRRCLKCKKTKGVDQFGFARAGKFQCRSHCKDCTNKEGKKYWRKNAKRFIERGKSYRAQPRIKKQIREAHLRRTYKISSEDFRATLDKQGGGCGLCNSKIPGGVGAFHVDHDHRCCPGRKSCGKCVRGVLCSRCNHLLGVFENNTKFFTKNAAKYIKTWRKENERI